jgi:hypothetical protein
VPLPIYPLRRTNRPPELNAEWDAPDWSRAAVAEVSHFHTASSAHRPRAEARLLYDDCALYVHFRVFDCYVRCVEEGDQNPVFRDSCVELFVQPAGATRGYFNFEMSCGGSLLLFHIDRPGKTASGKLEHFTRVSSDWLDQIKRFHTLPKRVEPEIVEPTEWRIAYSVPLALFEEYCGAPVDRGAWRGNFFKCADASSHPHWGMWSPVDVLNFHQPDRFGEFRLQ